MIACLETMWGAVFGQRRIEGVEGKGRASHCCQVPNLVSLLILWLKLSFPFAVGCALGPADRTFFVLRVFMLVGVVWLVLCALSQKLCGLNVIWAVNGFLLDFIKHAVMTLQFLLKSIKRKGSFKNISSYLWMGKTALWVSIKELWREYSKDRTCL